MIKTPFVFALVSGAAAALAPAGLTANSDWAAAWSETEPSLLTPGTAEYLQNRAAEFRQTVPELFFNGLFYVGEEGPPGAIPPLRPESNTFTGLSLSGAINGTGNLNGFYGVEKDNVNAVAFVKSDRRRSGDGAYVNDNLQASAELAFPDATGTVLGLTSGYVAASDKFVRGGERRPSPTPSHYAEGGDAKAFFRSNLWGKAKFATVVGVSYYEGRFTQKPVSDTALNADLRYDFFWWGEKLARGHVLAYQENYRHDRNQQGYLWGRFGLESDIPIEDRLYLSAGLAGGVLRRTEPEYYFYPISRLNLRLGAGWGCFVDYRPALELPSFQDLYLTADYLTPTSYRPVQDKYLAFRSGLTYYYRDYFRATAAAFHYRYRRTYAARDCSFGTAEYYDPGRAAVTGADLSYRIIFLNFVHFAALTLSRPELRAETAGRFPHYPAYNADAGVEYLFKKLLRARINAWVLGPRYPLPETPTPLRTAVIPAASLTVEFRPGVSGLLTATNFTDVAYNVPGGVAGPRRCYAAGVELIF